MNVQTIRRRTLVVIRRRRGELAVKTGAAVFLEFVSSISIRMVEV